MADINLDAATYEQIIELLTRLATNYSNMAGVFYDVFYNEEPKNVAFQMFDKEGNLRDYSVKNLALSNEYRVTDTLPPEGTIEAKKGTIYQNLNSGELFIKSTENGSQGWKKFMNEDFLNGFILKSDLDPNNIETEVSVGTLYVDTNTATLYINIGAKKWAPISSSFLEYASKDLDNITLQGINVIKDLIISELGTKETIINSNSTNGQIPTAKAVYDSVYVTLNNSVTSLNNSVISLSTNKQDKSNLVTSINSESTDSQYPSAKCMYDLIGNLEDILNEL